MAAFDRCLPDNGGCAQNCLNTNDSFICSCNNGFNLADDGLDCLGKYVCTDFGNFKIMIVIIIADVDECQESTDVCVQNCSNTVGSFECSCNVGFNQTVDGSDCLGNVFHFNFDP